MPVDTSIYRMLETPPPVATPTEVAAKKQTLANLAINHDLQAQQIAASQSAQTAQDLQNQDHVQQQREAQAIRDLLQGEPDLSAALPRIMTISPTAGAVFAKHIDEQRKAALDRQKAQAELYEKRKAAIAMDAAALLAEKDPAKRAAMYKVQHAARTASGLYTPNELAQFPSELPNEDELKAVADQLQMAKNADQERAAAEEKRKQETHTAELPSKTADKQTGLTPVQAETARHQKATEAEASRHNKAAEGAQTKANEIREKRLNVLGAQTANSKAIDERAVDKELQSMEKRESSLDGERQKLHNALTSGTVYVDAKGKTVPLASVAQDPATQSALITEMRQRYDRVTNERKSIADQKNKFLQSHGRAVGVPTATVVNAIDAGDGGVSGKPLSQLAAAPAKPGLAPVGAPPAVPVSAKPLAAATPQFTEAELRKNAKARGLDVEAAVAAARAKGLLK